MKENGTLTYEVVTSPKHAKASLVILILTVKNETNRHLRYAIIGQVHDYLGLSQKEKWKKEKCVIMAYNDFPKKLHDNLRAIRTALIRTVVRFIAEDVASLKNMQVLAAASRLFFISLWVT